MLRGPDSRDSWRRTGCERQSDGARADMPRRWPPTRMRQVDRATSSSSLQDVGAPRRRGGDAGSRRRSSHDRNDPDRELRLLVLLRCRRFVACCGCDKDKEVEPPAELVDIVAKRDVKSCGRRVCGGDAESLRLALRPRSPMAWCMPPRMTVTSSRCPQTPANASGRRRPSCAVGGP